MESNVVYASGPFVSGTSDSTGRGGSFFKLSTYLRVPTNLRVPTSFTKTSRILVANPRRESASRLLCGHIFGTSSRVGGYLKNYILGRVEN